MKRTTLALAALLLAAAGPVPEARPPLLPGRDAVLGYHLSPATGEPIDVRVTLRKGGGALRMDLPDLTYMLAVPDAQSLLLVIPLERTIVELAPSEGPQPLFLLDPAMRFTRKGEATVAGQRCTLWDTALDKARSTVCVTNDGIVLRNVSQDSMGRRNLVEAFAIRYQTADDAEFAVPDGFDRLLPPDAPGR